MATFESSLPEDVYAAFAACTEDKAKERLGRFIDLALSRLDEKVAPLPELTAAEEIASHFSAPLPEEGVGLQDTLEHIRRYVVPNCRSKRSPTYFAHIDVPPSDLSIFSGLLIRALTEDPIAYSSSRAGTHVEVQTIEWLKSLVFPSLPHAGGTMSSGGTQGTLHALLLLRNLALERLGKNVARDGLLSALLDTGYRGMRILTSRTCHPCVTDAACQMGLGTDAVVRLPVDEGDRLSLPALEEALVQCQRDKYLPMAVVLTAGTPGVGAIDPLREGAEIARRYGAQVHVDAAHGGFMLFSREHTKSLDGVEEADTVILDSHKVLGLNQGLGTLIVRDKSMLKGLAKTPLPYFMNEKVPHLGDTAIDGTRPLNSLGAWILLHTFGREGYSRIVDHYLEMTRIFVDEMSEADEFELLNDSPDLNLVNFRLRPRSAAGAPEDLEAENQRNEALLRTVNSYREYAASCFRHPSGRFYLRAVFVNPATKPHHVEAFAKALAGYAAELETTTTQPEVKRRETAAAMVESATAAVEAPLRKVA